MAAAVLTVFAVGGLAAFQIADIGQRQAPDEPAEQTNETVVVEYDTYQYVDRATAEFTTGFDNSSVVARNSTNATLTRGVDYKWNNTDGTILFLNTTNTTEGNTSYLSYDYRVNTQAVKDASGPLTAIVEAVGWIGVFAAGLALVVLLLAFGGIVANRVGSGGPPTRNR